MEPLTWLASYCGVPMDSVGTLPSEADGDRVAYTFGNLPVHKLQRPASKDLK